MAKSAPKVILNPSREIPFDRLELSQSNVRRVKAGVSIDTLATDIARRGLLQSLGVRAILDEQGQETGRYEVPFGGRRYRALELLVNRKQLAKDVPIPCMVRPATSDILAEEDSYAENAFRENLHPLDEFRAMQAMVEKGNGAEAIAAHFHTTPAVVRQRLKLATVSPRLLDLYGEDEMSLDVLMAFTVSDDHDRQCAVWDQLEHSFNKSPSYIRQRLTENSVRVSSASASEPADPKQRIGRANAEARVQPDRQGFRNAIQQYAWAEGALYQVYASPGQVTDIVLQEGEQLVGPGPVAAGDTVRWIIGDTVSGTGAKRRVHLLVKPVRADIMTNLIVNTDRRTYHVELRATPSAYMASVSWTYPADELLALQLAESEAARAGPVAAGIALPSLNFGYRLSGDRVPWRPVRVFDDGRQIFVEFAESIAVGEMPPLFILGEKDQAELVNYRVDGRYLVVDRLFERAELRLGTGRAAKAVRIKRSRSAS
jgi:type IV secretion system protein VirB9